MTACVVVPPKLAEAFRAAEAEILAAQNVRKGVLLAIQAMTVIPEGGVPDGLETRDGQLVVVYHVAPTPESSP